MAVVLPTQHDTTTTPRDLGGAGRLGELDLDGWQAFVEAHPRSTVFHHRRWIEAIQAQYGCELYIPCVKSGDEVEAAMPFLSSRSLRGAKKLVALPFTDCIGLLSRGSGACEALARALLHRHPACDSMSVRTDAAWPEVRSSTHWVRHTIALPGAIDSLPERFKPSVRRNLNKAQHAGLRFERRTDARAMEEFYRLHLLTRRKLGVPVQPKRFFRILQERLLQEGLGYLGLVVQGGRPIAAAVFLKFNKTVTYKYAASHPGALADRPNDWLVLNGLQVAVEEGYQEFDFGISARQQAGLRRFKRNWGAAESDVYAVQIVGPEKAAVEDSLLFRVSACLIRNSPAIVCRSLGEVFYRFAT